MIAANAASDWAQIAVTLLLGVVTAYIGLSIRQKRRQEIAVSVADNRLDAYAALWSKIPLSPELRKLTGQPALKLDERREIFDKMTAWYYGEGHGMMLGASTRSIYLTVKTNLICKPDQFVLTSCSADIRRSDGARSAAVIRQLSLLRSAMRADLEVYGKPWGSHSSPWTASFCTRVGSPAGEFSERSPSGAGGSSTYSEAGPARHCTARPNWRPSVPRPRSRGSAAPTSDCPR